jgi:eukaryotic-like serine/threonine-protein kinase
MELFIIFFFVFGAPSLVALYTLKTRHERKLRELEVQRLRALPESLRGTGEVEERIRNLESIVCSVDFELNSKLNRLASQQLLLAQASQSSAKSTAETTALSVDSLGPGSRVAGRFVVERALGSGGMGAVYLAHDDRLGEAVALKVIAGASMLDPAAADRFRQEASAARRISHPNVVRIHDIGDEHGLLFLSMEYVSGTSLAALIERHGVLPVEQLRSVVVQICQGLTAAHQAGVVHRDLKPANILVDDKQCVKIIDFGLARLPHLERMTATGLILGTPEYMAPEQVRGRSVDTRTDIYALGALIYHGLVGRPPFVGESPIAVGFAHVHEPLVPPREARPSVPEDWSLLVTRAMSKDPSERFDSAAALAAALPSV